MRRFAVFIAILTSSLSFAAGDPDIPTGLIIDGGGGEIKAKGEASYRPAREGTLIYPDDELSSFKRPGKILRCSPVHKDGAIYDVLSDGSEKFVRKLDYCSMPLLPKRFPAANGTAVDEQPGTPETRRAALTIAHRVILARKLESAARLEPESPFAATVLQAVALTEAGLVYDAIRAYRRLDLALPGTTIENAPVRWMQREIARLALYISLPVPSSESRVVPGAAARTIAQTSLDGGKTYAIVVGVSTYRYPLAISNLRFAANDSYWMTQFLESKRGGAVKFKDSDLNKWLPDDRANLEAVQSAINNFAAVEVSRKDTLIFYFAGHGGDACAEKDLDGKCTRYDKYLLLHESTLDDGKTSALAMSDVWNATALLARRFGRVLIVVDACKSAYVIYPPEVRGPDNRVKLGIAGEMTGLVGILTGSSLSPTKAVNEQAYELEYEGGKDGMGAFTYALLRELVRDAAAQETVLTVERLHSVVRTEVQKLFKDQIPDRWFNDQAVPFVLEMQKPAFELPKPGKLVSRQGQEPEPKQLAAARGLTSGMLGRDWRDVLDSGRLLPPAAPNAWDLLHAMPMVSAERQAAQQELHDALATAGQEIIGRYLQGEQVTVTKEEYERCDELFSHALRLRPAAAFDESRALFCRGRARIFDGRRRPEAWDEAEALLQQSIDIDPWRGYAWNALGISFLERATRDARYFDKAERAFSDAMRLAPMWAYPHHNRALVRWQQGQFPAAIADYKAARDVGPLYPYLPYNLGLLYQEVNKVEEARKAYQDAMNRAERRCTGLGSKPCIERAAPRAGLASLTASRGDMAGALKLYKQALDDDPDNLLIRHNYAKVLAESKLDPGKAVQIWEENLARPANQLHLVSLVGLINHLMSPDFYNARKAIPWLYLLKHQMPGYSPARLQLARALADADQPSEALDVLGPSPGADYNSTEWHLIRASAFRALGQSERSTASLSEARVHAKNREEKAKVRAWEKSSSAQNPNRMNNWR